MQSNLKYLEASFVSFMIHALIILYLLGFFYVEVSEKSIVSKPINVNLLFEEPSQKIDVQQLEKFKDIQPTQESFEKISDSKDVNKISFDQSLDLFSIQDLINEDKEISLKSDESKVDAFSSMIISNIQSAWRKPINIQDGLICEMRLVINKNGRIVKANLIKSSGNIRFDNSALKAVERVESFSFFDQIPQTLYLSNFKQILIKFNPK